MFLAVVVVVVVEEMGGLCGRNDPRWMVPPYRKSFNCFHWFRHKQTLSKPSRHEVLPAPNSIDVIKGQPDIKVDMMSVVMFPNPFPKVNVCKFQHCALMIGTVAVSWWDGLYRMCLPWRMSRKCLGALFSIAAVLVSCIPMLSCSSRSSNGTMLPREVPKSIVTTCENSTIRASRSWGVIAHVCVTVMCWQEG